MVSPISFIISKALIEIPFMFIFALAAIGLPGYVLMRMWSGNCGVMFVLVAVGLYA